MATTLRTLIATSAVLLVGVAIGGTATWLGKPSITANELHSYATARLLDVEYHSWTVFRLSPPQLAKEVQAFYIGYAYSAYKAGGIEKAAYHRALALAFTRDCVLYERSQDIKTAVKFCEHAAVNLEAWRPGSRFDEFRKEITSDDFHPSKLPN